MEHKLLNRGIYAIINKQLNMVYVGETQRNFLIRWVEH
ncbi:GIY-YIG nuclease family protein [Lysinibacillus sp. A1]